MKNILSLNNLRIGHRIFLLAMFLLSFIVMIGGVGVYKMNVIGHEMEEIAERDIPLTQILEKITVHQLEQAILMEKALRIKGVIKTSEGEDFVSVAKDFEKLAKKTDDEILEAEEMVTTMIGQTRSDYARKEFMHVLEELKKIEKEHKDYEHHVFEIFNDLEDTSKYYNSSVIDQSNQKILQVEKEQKELDKHIEALLFEVSDFTRSSMNKALADEKRGKILIATLSVVIFVLASFFTLILTKSVISPLKKLTDAMVELSNGNLSVEMPTIRFKDEVSCMCDAMKVFQKSMQRAQNLETEQEALKQKQQQRQNELNQLVGIFGATIGAVFTQILGTSKEMVDQAGNMLKQSASSQEMASSVAAEAEESATNSQSLGAATEQMVASIKEISLQVNKSSEVTKQAVEYSKASERNVKQLQDISREIGEVVSLITDIAEQTNLLALNATIEAARAGDAGKGFAVVASEVKSLANETAKATDEISGKIQAIQSASGQSAESIAQIGSIISNIDEYTTNIVAAIEEQNSVTEEISSNVQFVSDSSSRVSENVQKIQVQSSEVGQSSKSVNDNAEHMFQDADVLSREVETFLNAMSNTDINDDTYEPRKISVSVKVKVNGNTLSGQASEISSAHVVVSPILEYPAGESLEINLDGINEAIRGRIAKNENGFTVIQFPLDLDHMHKMKKNILKLL